MKLFYALAALASFLFVASVVVKADQPGDLVHVTAYCISKEGMDKLADVIRSEGKPGYDKFMKDSNSECIDSQFHPFPPIPVSLTKKYYEIKTPEGPTLIVWSVTALNNHVVYAWNLKEETNL